MSYVLVPMFRSDPVPVQLHGLANTSVVRPTSVRYGSVLQLTSSLHLRLQMLANRIVCAEYIKQSTIDI